LRAAQLLAVMADSQEQDPLLENSNDDEEAGSEQHTSIEVPTEAPPEYEAPKWSNPQPIGSSALVDIYAPGPAESPPPFESIASGPSDPSFGLRRVQLTRGEGGFGFTIGGGAPARIVSVEPGSDAERKGLRPNDRIMEVNTEDVTYSSVALVSSLIVASQQIDLAVITGLPEVIQQPAAMDESNDLWTQAFQNMDIGAMDPTQEPPSNMFPALLSFFFCPLIGCAAVWHANQVRPSFAANNVLRARGHSYMARRLAANAVFYGVVAVVLYLFVHLNEKSH
jgi:hypothetical protein